MSEFVRLVEVGARDGLQNEKAVVPAATKIKLIDHAARCAIGVERFGQPACTPLTPARSGCAGRQ